MIHHLAYWPNSVKLKGCRIFYKKKFLIMKPSLYIITDKPKLTMNLLHSLLQFLVNLILTSSFSTSFCLRSSFIFCCDCLRSQSNMEHLFSASSNRFSTFCFNVLSSESFFSISIATKMDIIMNSQTKEAYQIRDTVL